MKTLRKELLREIGFSRNRFLSIMTMVALGVLFLVGLRSAAPDMRKTADQYFDRQSFYDVQIASTLGLTDDDLAAFRTIDGVERVQGGWTLDGTLTKGEVSQVVKILDYSTDINLPELIEGNYPVEEDECLVDAKFLRMKELAIGDEIHLEAMIDDEPALVRTTYRIAGAANSPLYISVDRGTSTLGDGSTSGFVLLPSECFDTEAYTTAYVTASGAARLDTYGEAYEQRIDRLVDDLETIVEARADKRYEDLKREGEEAIEEAQSDLDEAKQEADESFADAQKELDEAEIKLADAQEKLDQAKKDYEDGEREGREKLEDSRAELDSGWEALEAALATLESSQRELDASRQQAQAQMEQASALLSSQEYAAQMAAANAQFEAAQIEINQGVDEYEANRRELEAAEEEYDRGVEELERELSEAREKITSGEAELEDGQAEYEEAKEKLATARADADKEIADAQQKIDDGREDLASLKPADTYVLDREANYGYVSYNQNATRMENLARMFPVIFFLVAGLVCLTTMTRMVDEQRTQIGSLKALGYDTKAIAGKYIVYGACAALLGSLLGAIVGSTIIPWVIFISYNVAYSLPNLKLECYPALIAMATLAGLLCTVGATLWAMLSTARERPAALMRPRAPKAGKRILLERITPIWKRLPFSSKVSARNLFRYKKRLWMTIIGVAGCTALLIVGLGLRTGVFDIVDIQFGEIYRYDIELEIDEEEAGTQEKVEAYFDESGLVTSSAALDTSAVTFASDTASIDGFLSVPLDPEALKEQMSLRTMDGEELDVPSEGIMIGEKLAEYLDVAVGDEITVDCGDMITVQVASIREHYVYHFGMMTRETYEAMTGKAYQTNEYMITLKEPTPEMISKVSEDLLAIGGVQGVTNLKGNAKTFRDTINAVDAAVLIIILSAAALAIVVLYNLTNINITERIRELATIKVLGFYDREVAMYVYRENIILTILGILLGQPIGRALCIWLIKTVEIDIVMFGRHVAVRDHLMSIALSLLFAFVVNVLMYFRMKKIDMVESLKSVE